MLKTPSLITCAVFGCVLTTRKLIGVLTPISLKRCHEDYSKKFVEDF